MDCAREPLPALPLRPKLLALPVLPLELLLLELELPLPLEPLPEAILPSGQSALERALLLPLRPDVLPDVPMEPVVPEPELPVPNPCELLPLEEPPLVCDQPGCKPNASVLDRANAAIRIFRLLIRSCLLQFVIETSDRHARTSARGARPVPPATNICQRHFAKRLSGF